MGTTHFTGLNVRAGTYHAEDGPASTGALSIVGIEVGDTILNIFGFKITATGTNTVATMSGVTLAASVGTVTANTVTLAGTTAYSGYGFIVLYLDVNAT